MNISQKGKRIIKVFLLSILFSQLAVSQEFDSLWLRYDKLPKESIEGYKKSLSQVQLLSISGQFESAIKYELKKGLSGLLGEKAEMLQDGKLPMLEEGLIIGTSKHIYIREQLGDLSYLGKEGYVIREMTQDGKQKIILAAADEQGLLYGTFHLLRLLQQEKSLSKVEITEIPKNKLRMVNHWDDPVGHVERVYSDKIKNANSAFHWDNMSNLTARDTMYMRLMASVGINASCINNVNTKTNKNIGWKLLTSERIDDLAPFAELLSSYGIKMYLSVNFASPILIGGLETADPMAPQVIAWWEEKAAECFEKLPGFGGFLVKADSENEAGPLTYKRNHADGANMLAKAVRPYGGHIVWRAFIYFWPPLEGMSKDGAMHPYEFFAPLDGKFEDNVMLQSKFGSVDFQVREPLAPLIGGLPYTNTNVELQITQEYTGHATHLCFLVPQWKSIFDTDTHVAGKGTTVAKVVDGTAFDYSFSGVSGVMNFGDDPNWTGHYLAQANTYGFGRLIWNPELSSEAIAEEWTRLTFGNDDKVVATLPDILINSWETYEKYTSPLGVGFLHHINHYDPEIVPQWDKRHGFTQDGAGTDRTMATGSGYTAHYHQPLQSQIENLETCPEEWLFFFHHVPYTHRLKSGKTVIQHIYDTHFEGVENVERFISQWKSLKGKIDDERYAHTLKRFEAQLAHAKVWRDHVNGFFYNKSSIEDKKDRITEEVKNSFKGK